MPASGRAGGQSEERDWLDTAALPRPGDEAALELHRDLWREAAEREDDEALRAFCLDAGVSPGARALLDAVFANSPFLSRCLIADPPFARLLIEKGPDAACARSLDGANGVDVDADESSEALMKRLRIAKRRAALAIGVADIAAAWPLDRITGRLSELAEASLRAVCRHLLRAAHESGGIALPDPERPETGSGLIVLGMGKLGAHELNYSSDVDLIVLYDEDRADCRGEPQRLFVRLARRLVAIMEERTADGYVFRTDLRLRPDPASTPLALSVRAAGSYYETAGRTWERAAMIKARPVAGDDEAGAAFLDTLGPFVWRRRLDFAAVQDMQGIKRKIDASRGGGRIAVEGHDVKLGRGGIREIEFFAQAQQLAWGGRDPDLRGRETVPALDALAVAGRITRRAAAELRKAYEFLRGVEHRIQMVNDAQTQKLPSDAEGMARAAAFMGFDSTEAFSAALVARLRTVERHYAALFEDRAPAVEAAPLSFAGPSPDDDADTLRALSEMGYGDGERAWGLAHAWLTGRYAALRGERARELAAEIAPVVLHVFATSPDPDSALSRFDGFLARLPDGVRLFSLFAANPELLGLVAEVMGVAPRLAERLTLYPDLLESVLSRDFADLEVPDDIGRDAGVADAARRGLVRLFYAREFGLAEMREQLAGAVGGAADFQDFMSAQRRWANDRAFQIGVHVLRGLLTPVEAARPLSDIADASLGALMPAVEEAFASRHGRVPGGRVAVVAFGKLGSREMTAGSDLDLLFLYDHDAEAVESDGARALAPSDYYARLCRRLIAAATAPTAEGAPWRIDMRLRPSGNAGPLACSLDAFVRYQRSQAWTWEHQALTRARVVHDEGGLGARFDEEKHAVLTRPRDPAALARDVVEMRGRIRREHGGADAGSVKHIRGGLLDTEFAAQFLQLAHAAQTPELLAGDPISVFAAAGKCGVIDSGMAHELAEAATLWRNLQGILRLTLGVDYVAGETTGAFRSVVGRSCGRLVFEALVESMEETAARTARHFDGLVGDAAG